MIGQSVGSDASPLSCFLFRPRKSREKCRKRSHTNVSNTLVTRPSTPPAQTPQRSFRGAAAGTHLPSPTGSHTATYTPKQGLFRMGRYHYPRHELHVHEHPRAGYQNGKLCRFGVLVGGTPEGHREPAEQRCAYARRCSAGVAAPLGCVFFCFCRNCGLYALHSELSVRAKQGWYHYPRRALHAAEMPDGRLSKRFICRFLASPIYICESSRRALPISASIQIACCWISRGHIACPWLIQA